MVNALLKGLVGIALILSSAPSVAESSASLSLQLKRRCESYAKETIANDYQRSRGGRCAAGNLSIDPTTAKHGYIGLTSIGREIPVVLGYGVLTLSCNGAAFFADETFALPVRVMTGPFPYGPCSVNNE